MDSIVKMVSNWIGPTFLMSEFSALYVLTLEKSFFDEDKDFAF